MRKRTQNRFAPIPGRMVAPNKKQIGFEVARVRAILVAFGLQSQLPAMYDEHARQTGEKPRLNFETFFNFFPTFPIILEANSFFRLRDHYGPAALFRSFARGFVLDRYRELFDRMKEEAQGRPIGMIFNFDGYRGGAIMHNGNYDTRGTKLIHDVANDEPPHRITVETFVRFLKYLARGGWTPDEPVPQKTPVQTSRVSRLIPVEPWMINAIGCNAAVILLGWLIGVMRSQSAYHSAYIRRTHDGDRCVVATHAQMAHETGLTERCVKRALARLRAKGFIHSNTHGMRSSLNVNCPAVRLARRNQDEFGGD